MTAIDDSEETVLSVTTDEDEMGETAAPLFTGGPLAETSAAAEALEPPAAQGELVPQSNSPQLVERIQERRLRARKVRRLVRHIEPWSVLKVGLLFNFCMWIVTMVAGVLLWNAAETAGCLLYTSPSPRDRG